MTYLNLTKCRIIEEWVDSIINRFESMTHKNIPLPIPVDRIVEVVFGMRVDRDCFTEKYKATSGFYITGRNQIFLNTNQSLFSSNFTIAHELAHYLLDDPESVDENGVNLNEKLPFLLFRHENEKEKVANYFAAALLIPKRELIRILNNRLWVYSRDLPEVSELFGVNLQTLVIRLEDLREELSQYKIQLQLNTESLGNMEFRKKKKQEIKANLLDNCVIDIDYDYIDHHLTRKLKELKQHYKNLYLLYKTSTISRVQTLLDFQALDGLALFESFDKLSSLASPIGKGFQYVCITKDRWPSMMEHRSLALENNAPQIHQRRKGTHVDQKQQYLIKMNEIITPNSTLHGRIEAKEFIRKNKALGKVVVIVTGCFDLITNAHVKFLKRAKAQGDILVVGLEDDNRVKAFKGSLRPYHFIHQRIEVMEALSGIIDYVFIIRGPVRGDLKEFYTRLHRELKADILAVSEGDPNIEDRRDEIESVGGKIVEVSKFEEGSTTSLLRQALAELPDIKEFVFINKRILTINQSKNNWTQPCLFS